jgi:NitT/TauT family transport system permease protein
LSELGLSSEAPGLTPLGGETDPRRLVRGRSRRNERVRSWTLQILIVAACIGLWEVLAVTETVDPFFVSTPPRVAERLWQFISSGMIFDHAWVTLHEALEGYVLGAVVGTAIGFVLGHSRVLSAALLPLLNLANTLPRVALAPLFILWFGLGETSKIVLVFTIVVVILVFNTYAGTQTVDRDLLTNARLLGASKLQLVRKVTLPWTLPWIISGMRIALAWSIGGAVIGEFIAAKAGLGYLLFSYANVLDQTGLLAICVVLLIISGVLFAILGIAERYLLRWRPERF